MSNLDIETTHGLAKVNLLEAEETSGLLILGPGASGKADSADLLLVAKTAHDIGLTVAIVSPPYAVAGKKVPPRGTASDEAWVEVVQAVHAQMDHLPIITGGRSYGSRVACRAAAATGSIGVLCLAFPLHPPGKPEQSRIDDLEAATVPTLVIQGRSDPFGTPPDAPDRRVVLVDGDHSLKKQHDVIAEAVRAWLADVLSVTR